MGIKNLSGWDGIPLADGYVSNVLRLFFVGLLYMDNGYIGIKYRYIWIMDIQLFDILIQSCFFAINGDIYQPYFLNKGAHCRMSKIGHRNRWGMMKGMWIINSMLSHI